MRQSMYINLSQPLGTLASWLHKCIIVRVGAPELNGPSVPHTCGDNVGFVRNMNLVNGVLPALSQLGVQLSGPSKCPSVAELVSPNPSTGPVTGNGCL
jgi:hypothetical protein